MINKIEQRVVPRAYRVFKVGDVYYEDETYYVMIAVQTHTVILQRISRFKYLLFTIRARLSLACTYLIYKNIIKIKRK